jgi:uncharacterized Zn finger protein
LSDEEEVQKEVREAEIGEEFRVCPECGYERGFHNMFRPSGNEGVLNWYFICPNCGTRFDVGLTVPRG